jgi:hypothetical protein
MLQVKSELRMLLVLSLLVMPSELPITEDFMLTWQSHPTAARVPVSDYSQTLIRQPHPRNSTFEGVLPTLYWIRALIIFSDGRRYNR